MRIARAFAAGFCLLGCAVAGTDGKDDVGQVVSQLVSGTGEATLVLTSNWGSGYCAEVSVANKGSASITTT